MEIEEQIEKLAKEIEGLDAEIEKVQGEWLDEVKEYSSKPNFDNYSKETQKMFRKISDKYTPIIAELEAERELLIEEHNSLIDELEKN